MSDIFKNIRGTTRDVFKIGKNGSNIFVRNNPPSSIEGFNGDCCLINGSVPTILKKMNGDWIDINSKYIIEVTSTTFTYSPTTSNDIILCNNSDTLTITIDTLPPKGHTFDIKDSNGNAGTFDIIIDCINGITLDGSSTATINNNYTSITILSTGTELLLI